jgi:hypothetical protein
MLEQSALMAGAPQIDVFERTADREHVFGNMFRDGKITAVGSTAEQPLCDRLVDPWNEGGQDRVMEVFPGPRGEVDRQWVRRRAAAR